MWTNLHTHSTWCDGRDTPRVMAEAACAKGFEVLGFSSHASVPTAIEPTGMLDAARLPAYADEIRNLAREYAGRLEIRLGVEAEYLAGIAAPDRPLFAAIAPDYIIGSVHFVRADDGAVVSVDHTPEKLEDGIRQHFEGDVRAFIRAYFEAEREMLTRYDFDILGHPDLVRKFNEKHPYFDEHADWYLEELENTADVIAASGKQTEINTGAISRGWLEDAYPSAEFREMLQRRGVSFILSSDAHSADGLDCGFAQFAVE